jgi:hypothetical protein
VVSDRTGGHREGVFEAAIDKLGLLRPAFVMSVGDLIEGYTEDPLELDAEWRELDGMLEGLDAPFFFTAGNHDFSNEVMSREWRARHGSSFYSFRYQGVLFLVLNSELFPGVARPTGIPGPDTQADQLAWLRRVLERNEDARWTFVFLHRPLWDRRRVHEDWLAIEDWLGDRPYTVFAGHIHRYTEAMRHARRYITLGTTGGASPLRGLDQGEFDHVTLVSVGDGEPVIANLLLDGIHGADARTADTRERVRRLERAIESEPLLADGPVFRRGTARFSVQNTGAEPLHVEARVQGGRDLEPATPRLSGQVPAGERQTFDVPLVARNAGPVGALAPGSVDWTLRTRKADGSPLEVTRVSWLLPETRFECPRAARAPTVDGRLTDWDALPFEIDARPAPADAPQGASLRFGVTWDDDFLYLAARVVDPSPDFDASRTARDQDAVHVTLDARPAPQRDANQGIFRAQNEGWLSELLFAWLLPGESRRDRIENGFLPALPPGTRRAARTTDAGYDVELAIPNAFLDERQGGAWQSFRLNVALQDSDGAGGRVVHWWRPSRFGHTPAAPVPGAGTFWRTGPQP